LSRNAAMVTREAMQTAKKDNVIGSFDLNYRSKLWSEDEAQNTITPLMNYCDILITTEEDAFRVFKIKEENYERVAEKLYEKFGFKIVVITLRDNISVWRNKWTSIAYSEQKFYSDTFYDIEIVDRVGSGDSFTAGFLYGYLTFDENIELCLKHGNASAALKPSVPGDLNWCTIEEIKNLAEGGKNLRIKR